jgi:hypothetical protein
MQKQTKQMTATDAHPSLLEVICDWRNWADDNPNVPNALLGSNRAKRIDDAINRGDETLRQRDDLLEAAKASVAALTQARTFPADIAAALAWLSVAIDNAKEVRS